MKLTKKDIDEVVAACGGGDLMRAALTRAFGERVNPYELSRGCGGPVGLVLSFLVGFASSDTLRDSGVKLGQGRE
jgi:hypothetical protein